MYSTEAAPVGGEMFGGPFFSSVQIILHQFEAKFWEFPNIVRTEG